MISGRQFEKADSQNTSPLKATGKQSPSSTYKGVHYICLQAASECHKEPMEQNSIPPPYVPPNANPPHYNQIPAYEYDAQAQYEPVHVYEQPGAPAYYVTTGYSAEYNVARDTHYVLEAPPPGSFYPNGYPSTSNAYPHIAYPPPHGVQPGIVYSTTAPPYDQRSQSLGQRQFVDAKGYPIGSRNVVQLVEMPKPGGVPQLVDPNAAKGKPIKKRSLPVSTHTISTVPIDAESKADNKKQFKCDACGKCVSSSRNLNRHRESCKAKKQKSGEDTPECSQSKSSSSSLGSPPKQKPPAKQPAPLPMPSQNIHPEQHPGQPPPNYPTFVPSEGNLPPNVIYQGAPPNLPPYTPHYPPHTALPHSSSQPAFEYPNLHSAPPTMSNFQPPLTSLQNYVPPANNSQTPAYDAQRPIEYNGEPMNGQVYSYPAPIDSFIENAIDEMAQNPLAYLGTDYESNSSDRSLHDSSDFSSMRPTVMRNGPPSLPGKPLSNTQLPAAGSSGQQKSKSDRKSGERRKNMVPTPHKCNACSKYMCSQRSLRRHKSTCKLYLNTTPELTAEEKQLIAKNEENKCENCGKVLQSPSNLRRHQANCKQKSEDESKPPLSNSVQANNSPTRNPTIVEHLTSQLTAANDSNSGPKRLMPPPEAQDPNYSATFPKNELSNHSDGSQMPATSATYIKTEDLSQYQDAGPGATIGEHLKHRYIKTEAVSPGSKTPVRRPLILGRKTSLQNVEINTNLDDALVEPPATCPPGHSASPHPNEFHSRSAPPIDMSSNVMIKQEFKPDSEEAIRKSEQVAGVIDSVVERIRRQNVVENVPHGEKRPNSSNDSIHPSKMAKFDNRPLASIITTQPLPSTAVNHLQLSPRYNPGPVQQQPAMIQQRSMSMPQPGIHQTQIQVPFVAAEQESTEESKIVARYLCPECQKFYACRKTIIKHRIEMHKITAEETEANAAKRVKVRSDDGFILTPGFDRENAILKERSITESVKPTIVKMSGQPKKRNSTASNGDGKVKKSPVKIPNGQQHPIEQIASQGPSAQFYIPGNSSNGLHYEQLRAMEQQYGPQHPYAPNMQQHPVGYNPNFMASDHLEMWDQIKNRVDDPFLARRDNDMNVDVARIAADLKAEFEVQHHHPTASKLPNANGDFHSLSTDTDTADPMLSDGNAHSVLNDSNESDQHKQEDGTENGQNATDHPLFMDEETVVKS